MNIGLLALIIVGAMILFVTEVYSVDQVSVLVMVALIVSGLVSLHEGLAGFSSTATITVGAFFVITMAIRKTGLLEVLAHRLTEMVGNRPRALLAAIIGMSAVSSTFVHATGVVALYMPVVIEAARRMRQSPSRYLIPLSYAAQFGGVMTLLGTTSNLVVSGIMVDHKMQPIGMFEVSRLGVILFAVGFAYLLLVGWHVLPARRSHIDPQEEYGLDPYLVELMISPTSPLRGKTLIESDLRHTERIHVLEILRGEQRLWNPPPTEVLHTGDVLVSKVTLPDMMSAYQRLGLELPPDVHVQEEQLTPQTARLVEVMVTGRSDLLDQSVRQSRFAERFGASVLAIKRPDVLRVTDLRSLPLRQYDTLLVQGTRSALEAMASNPGFIMLSQVEHPRMRQRNVVVVVAVMMCVVAATSTHLVDVTVAALVGAAVLLATKVLRSDEAYATINWKVIFLIVGMVPLGTALEHSGMAAQVANLLREHLATHPAILLSGAYLMTMIVTEFITHVATAVLMTPLVLSLAAATGLDPRPFCIAVAFAADTSFSTPVGYQTNAMVFGPGGYKFRDFIKVGVPLNIIFWLLASWLIPMWWPLQH